MTRQTQQPQKERPENETRADTGAPSTPDRATTADIERAQQRLAQETDRVSATQPESPEQARALVERLAQQISADPRAAMQAMGQANGILFEAATAEPT